MTIVINSTHFIPSPGYELLYDYFIQLAASKPEHQFIFTRQSAKGTQLAAAQNIRHIKSSPVGNNPLIWKIWLNYTLPGIARKWKADIIIHTGGVSCLHTKIPQYLIISDLSFLHFPHFFSRMQLRFLKKNMQTFLDKADTIAATADFLKNEITQQYAVDEEKIHPFQWMPSDHFHPVDWAEKEVIKENYAEGKEYFLFSGDIHPRNNLVNLLKAFSAFKKRQQSNMQLMIAAKGVSLNNPFTENLKTYKYRSEVKLLPDLPVNELAKITAAAYAFVYPALYEGISIFVLQAMQCDVPVITGNTRALIETTGDAGLHADAANFEDIAAKMMLLFKDENKRAGLIASGKKIIRENKAGKKKDLWSLIEPMINAKIPV